MADSRMHHVLAESIINPVRTLFCHVIIAPFGDPENQCVRDTYDG